MNNLLSNAFKFTREGDRISVFVREIQTAGRSQYQILVTDTGVGMSKEFLNKIFIPYERETRFGTKHILGTGLGMAIVKNLVSQMNGTITVESELEKGSSFMITLPLEYVADSEGAENTAAETGAQENSDTKSFSLSGKKILLAEDNAINMEIETELFTQQGFEITPAWDGAEAVEKFKRSPLYYFDAILMDMQMPVMDGCEAAKAIRALDREDAKSIPMIAVTANAFAEDLNATTAAGMNAHIAKPIDFASLSATLKKLLHERSS